jgi:hypothetical protein
MMCGACWRSGQQASSSSSTCSSRCCSCSSVHQSVAWLGTLEPARSLQGLIAEGVFCWQQGKRRVGVCTHHGLLLVLRAALVFTGCVHAVGRLLV